MELVDENADSVETMSYVAELVLERLSSASQEWLVLVGDVKTYVHLQQTKRLYIYESALSKQIIHVYPGDWHIL